MNNILKTALLSTILVAPSIQAANIFSSGDYVFNGSTAIVDDNSVSGIGRVLNISKLDGTSVWSSGDYGAYINFNFENFADNTGNGDVQFWLNAVDLYDTTVSWATSVAAQATGTLYIDANQHGVGAVGTHAGSIGAVSHLDVVGGAQASLLDTNSQYDGSDITFNFTGSSFDNDFYDYTGSADGVGTVPTPGVLWLLGAGMIGMLTTQRRKLA